MAATVTGGVNSGDFTILTGTPTGGDAGQRPNPGDVSVTNAQVAGATVRRWRA